MLQALWMKPGEGESLGLRTVLPMGTLQPPAKAKSCLPGSCSQRWTMCAPAKQPPYHVLPSLVLAAIRAFNTLHEISHGKGSSQKAIWPGLKSGFGKMRQGASNPIFGTM
eukprot:364579-Chlamydomonas_euryale.AAC.9